MKKLLPLLLALVLLTACGAPAPAPVTVPTETAAPTAVPAIPEPQGLYLEGTELENATGGALRVYPLNCQLCHGILPLGEDLLVLTGPDSAEAPVTLRRLSGDNLYVTAETAIEGLPYPDINLFQVDDRGISYYNEGTRQMVLLDNNLRQLRAIDVPRDLGNVPMISSDWKTLYYGTETAVRALDLDSGIDRVLRESPELYKNILALLMDDTVVQCALSGDSGTRVLFLSADTGMILSEIPHYSTVATLEGRYYTSFVEGAGSTLLFGKAGENPQALVPADFQSAAQFLPGTHSALSFLYDPEADRMDLHYYDLSTGKRVSSIHIPGELYPWYMVSTDDGRVYLELRDPEFGDSIYRWDWEKSPVEDALVYTGIYHTAESPDYEGLERCQDLACEIGEKYGIEILLWKDAVDFQPWDYEFEPEYQVPFLEQELRSLDDWLGRYPQGLLPELSEQFAGLRLCLVRTIAGSPESGSLDLANGLQYWDGSIPYLALATGMNTEYTLFHELFHVMDSYILTVSNAYDNWDRLNPEDFRYDYDYVANINRDGDRYLEDGTRSFIDTYSMSFPGEDRARIMEYAMTSGNARMFQSKAMQAKLRQLSLGIRDAFGLKKSPEEFRWEQYLIEPLACTE